MLPRGAGRSDQERWRRVVARRGGYSGTEIIFPYGGTLFASIMGQLAGNHFLTVTEGREQLRELARTVLWEGAQDIVFEAA